MSLRLINLTCFLLFSLSLFLVSHYLLCKIRIFYLAFCFHIREATFLYRKSNRCVFVLLPKMHPSFPSKLPHVGVLCHFAKRKTVNNLYVLCNVCMVTTDTVTCDTCFPGNKFCCHGNQ